MALPTQKELDERKADLQKRLFKLKSAYNGFLREWSSVDFEQRELLRELRACVDRSQVVSILDKLDNLKE